MSKNYIYIYSEELRVYEKAIREFYTQLEPKATNTKINELVETDILEMEGWLTNNTIDRKVWDIILNYTQGGRRLIEANPEEFPTSLKFDRPNEETTEVSI